MEIWYLKEADIPAGSNSFAVTYASGTPGYYAYAAATYQNVNQTSPVLNTNTNQDSTVPHANPLETTVNVATGGMAVAAAVCGNDGSYTWGTWTEVADISTGSTQVGVADKSITADGTATASATFTGSVYREVIAAVSFSPASAVTLANHAAGQEADKFTTASSVTGAELFAFKLTNNSGSQVTISSLVLSLSSVTGVAQGDFANLAIYEDTNGDGAISGESTTVGGAGVVNATPSTITFSTSFNIAASTTKNYILKGDVSNLVAGDTVTIGLTSGNVTLSAGTISGSTTSVAHTADAATIGASLISSITDDTDANSYAFPSAAYSNNVLYIAFTNTSIDFRNRALCHGCQWGRIDFY